MGEHVSARRAKAALLVRARRLTRPGDWLLDVGCGTGSEMQALARAGRRVVGVDVAPRMVAAARRKLGAGARLHEGAAADAGPAWLPPGVPAFDLAYSAFGVLNLEDDPGAALGAIGALVRPGGHVLVGTVNPTPWYELCLYPLGLRFKGYRKAFRPVVALKVGHGRAEEVRCRLPSNRAWGAMGRARGLRLVEEVGLHVAGPPPGEDLVRRFPRLVARANRIDERVESQAPFSRLGYFSLLVFRRDVA